MNPATLFQNSSLRMRITVIFALVNLIIATLFASAGHTWPVVYPTGTTLYNPENSFNGYTLFTPVGRMPGNAPAIIYLINMNGEVVHRWNVPFPPLYGRLLPNGNLIVIGQNEKNVPGRPGMGKLWIGGVAGWLVELTWDGQEVFRHEDLNMHHDFAKLPNGNYLYLAWERVPEALRARVRGGIKGSEFDGGLMFNDKLVEVDNKGRVVWTWHANDHLDPELDIIGPMYKRQEWGHANSLAVLRNGDIAITSRSLDSLMVIDKKSGRITSRWGNASYLDKRTGRLEHRTGPHILGGPHDVQEIPPGLPGAGHLTCYDNGLYDSFKSRVVELNPKTGKLVWQSPQERIGRKHFSDFMGSAQRLPNGNTLVCDGANGRLLQIVDYQVVWEYINPYSLDIFAGAIFKAHMYAPDYCLQFKSLPPAKGKAVDPKSKLPGAQPQDTGAAASQEEPPIDQRSALYEPIAWLIVLVMTALLSYYCGRRAHPSP